ncbi:unnamed protein product [Mytilus coruscus]|uniref:C-type lectin domain-containing protein n=1 Tax=Mytilus coruscus TaxID=42192 RepID=A0A6J8DI88_MYTCO|nr:unnamed protein product [Mytilus coruscus]
MTVNYNLIDQLSLYLKLVQFDDKHSLIRCTNRCLLRTNCRSLFYHYQTKQCILHSLNILELSIQGVEVNLVTSAGWKYYERAEDDISLLVQCISSPGFLYNTNADMCYFVGSPVNVDFGDIKQLCLDMGSDLIRIDSAAKQMFVQQILVNDVSDRVCIQGNNDNSIKTYRFDNATDMTYFNWNTASSQPDNAWYKHYIMMLKNYNYLWHNIQQQRLDVQCAYICEK